MDYKKMINGLAIMEASFIYKIQLKDLLQKPEQLPKQLAIGFNFSLEHGDPAAAAAPAAVYSRRVGAMGLVPKTAAVVPMSVEDTGAAGAPEPAAGDGADTTGMSVEGTGAAAAPTAAAGPMNVGDDDGGGGGAMDLEPKPAAGDSGDYSKVGKRKKGYVADGGDKADMTVNEVAYGVTPGAGAPTPAGRNTKKPRYAAGASGGARSLKRNNRKNTKKNCGVKSKKSKKKDFNRFKKTFKKNKKYKRKPKVI